MARVIRVQQGGALRFRRGGEPRPRTLYPLIRSAARAALKHERVPHAEISITLLDDPAITELNRRFLRHDRPTDVIAFALFDDGEPPVGDIYIGFDDVMRHAAAHAVPPGTELARVTVHGTLHVLGYDHPEGAARTRSDMWRRQERILADLLGHA